MVATSPSMVTFPSVFLVKSSPSCIPTPSVSLKLTIFLPGSLALRCSSNDISATLIFNQLGINLTIAAKRVVLPEPCSPVIAISLSPVIRYFRSFIISSEPSSVIISSSSRIFSILNFLMKKLQLSQNGGLDTEALEPSFSSATTYPRLSDN